MDGYITIGTKLSTDKFDRQVQGLEKKMKKEEDKKIIIETSLSNQEQELEIARKKVDELADAYQRLKAIQDQQASGGRLSLAQTEELQSLESTYGSLEKINGSFDKALSKQNQIESKVESTKIKYEEISNSISDYKQKIDGVNLAKHSAEVSKMKQGFSGVGSSIQDAVKKAGHLVLGIFAIRSAYQMLKSSSSELATYDKEYASNIEYIRFALTQMIAPVLKYIVNLAATILNYINAIAQAWFGVNLFSNASAKDFEKMKKSLDKSKKGASGVSKAVKELKKQLAGFDEVNILSEDKDKKSGGSDYTAPSFDLGGIQGDVPAWLQWIIDNKDLLLSVLAGVLAGIVAIKLGVDGLTALGIGILVAGIVLTIQSLIAYLNDPSWENFGKVISSIGVAIIGLGIIIGSVPLAIAGAIALILGIIISNWDKIQAFLQGGIDWLLSKMDWVKENFGLFGEIVFGTIIALFQGLLNIFNDVFMGIKNIFDGIIKIVKGVFTGDWKLVWEGLKQIVSGVLTIILGTFKNIFNTILTIAKNIFKSIGNFISGIFKTILNLFKGFGTKVGNAVSGAFKTVINGVLGAVETILNAPINAINGLIDTVNSLPRCKYRQDRNI